MGEAWPNIGGVQNSHFPASMQPEWLYDPPEANKMSEEIC